MFYVDVKGESSYIKKSDSGTIQGSRLGPILYAIYVSPLFDIADDNFIITFHKNKLQTVTLMETKLKLITTWLTDSGLKVNEAKTESCLFHRKDSRPIEIHINNVTRTP